MTLYTTLHPNHKNSMSSISPLLLTRFWWNSNGRFLGTSRTDSNRQGDICLSSICPRAICPYQEYLSCYWPDFDETLQVGSRVHLEQILTVTVTFVQAIFVQATFVLVTFVHIRNISAVTDTVKGKVNARSRQCQGKVKARSRQGQGKVNARLRQG